MMALSVGFRALNLHVRGKPTQHSYVERFNRIFRDDALNFSIFNSLSEIRVMVDKWITGYLDCVYTSYRVEMKPSFKGWPS
jgi:hypothetical protein